MSNIAISEITNVVSTLDDGDLLLVSKAGNSNTYTSSKLTYATLVQNLKNSLNESIVIDMGRDHDQDGEGSIRGWKLYANGLLEQWGYIPTTSTSAISYTINLKYSYHDTNFVFLRNAHWKSQLNTLSSYFDNGYESKTVNSITFHMHENTYQYGSDYWCIGYHTVPTS